MTRAAEVQAESVESNVAGGRTSSARDAGPKRKTGAQTQLKSMSYSAGADSMRPGTHGSDDHVVAARGVSGEGHELPYRDVAEQALGVDASVVRAHTGPEAIEACNLLGADAYAWGTDIAFAVKPTPELVAHELCHVVQQTDLGRPSVDRKASGFGAIDPNSKIGTLHPVMQGFAQQLFANAHKKGLNVWAFEGMRSFERQNELYAQGRTKPGNIVTWVKGGGSYHNYGLAIDVVFHGSQPWGEQHNWSALGEAGQEAGLKWGGSFGDRPHFQIQGLSISSLKTWHAQGGMSLVWSKVSETLGGGGGAVPDTGGTPGGGGYEPGNSYTVQSGDTLGKISQKFYGTSSKWKDIADANNITNPNKIYPGQSLTIPGTGSSEPAPPATEPTTTENPDTTSTPSTYTVKSGDTLGKIAAALLGSSAKWKEIADANNLSNPNVIYPGQTLKIPGTGATEPEPSAPSAPTAPVVYTVKSGDTLGKIASAMLGSASQWKAIAEANNLSNPNFIYPGQKLTIPGASGNEPAPEAPPTAAPTPSTYTVLKGDTLSGIAKKVYGDMGKWPQLAAANGLFAPYVIHPGQVLTTTPGAAPPTTQPPTTQPPTTQPPTTEPSPEVGPTPKGGKNDDPSMQPADQVSLQGLSGLKLAMAKIYNSRGKYLSQKAGAMGVAAESLAAVLHVEAGGNGFSSATDKMIVRFENHIFYNQWGKSNSSKFFDHFQFGQGGQSWQGHKYRQSTSQAWQSFHGNQTKEWEVLQFARSLSDTHALMSISMGIAQIMGFNHAKVGFATVQDMFQQMGGSIVPQLDGMLKFIENTPNCIQGLQSKNYVQFATGYNGAGKANSYGALISSAADAYLQVTAGVSA